MDINKYIKNEIIHLSKYELDNLFNWYIRNKYNYEYDQCNIEFDNDNQKFKFSIIKNDNLVCVILIDINIIRKFILKLSYSFFKNYSFHKSIKIDNLDKYNSTMSFIIIISFDGRENNTILDVNNFLNTIKDELLEDI